MSNDPNQHQFFTTNMTRRFLNAVLLAILSIGWSTIVVAGFAQLDIYSATPGALSKTPAPALGQLGKWQWVMSVSPECPCSRASVTALKAVAALYPDSTSVTIYFKGAIPDGNKTHRIAGSIPNVVVREEPDRVRSEISGQVWLYDPRGKVVYSGGLTPGRGVDTPTYAIDLYRRARHGTLQESVGNVFGCAIRKPQS